MRHTRAAPCATKKHVTAETAAKRFFQHVFLQPTCWRKPVPKIPAIFVATLLAAIGFASAAEAHARGFHSPMFFRDEGPMEPPPHHHCQSRAEREFAIEQERRRELAAARAEQIAAAKRAQMVAMRKEAARKAAANAEAAEAAKARQIAAEKSAAIAKKEDLAKPAATNTATTETKTAAVTETGSVASSSDRQLCRKYSAAADGLIDVPCK